MTGRSGHVFCRRIDALGCSCVECAGSAPTTRRRCIWARLGTCVTSTAFPRALSRCAHASWRTEDLVSFISCVPANTRATKQRCIDSYARGRCATAGAACAATQGTRSRARPCASGRTECGRGRRAPRTTTPASSAASRAKHCKKSQNRVTPLRVSWQRRLDGWLPVA